MRRRPMRLLDGLRTELKGRTNVNFDLRVVPVADLPQWTTPDVKPRRWTDERQANLSTGGTEHVSAPDVDEARAALAEVIRLAGLLVEASGDGDELGLRNRAIEIAALAENLLWSVDPDASDWLLDLYDR